MRDTILSNPPTKQQRQKAVHDKKHYGDTQPYKTAQRLAMRIHDCKRHVLKVDDIPEQTYIISELKNTFTFVL